jgi:hypothetical protein
MSLPRNNSFRHKVFSAVLAALLAAIEAALLAAERVRARVLAIYIYIYNTHTHTHTHCSTDDTSYLSCTSATSVWGLKLLVYEALSC